LCYYKVLQWILSLGIFDETTILVRNFRIKKKQLGGIVAIVWTVLHDWGHYPYLKLVILVGLQVASPISQSFLTSRWLKLNIPLKKNNSLSMLSMNPCLSRTCFGPTSLKYLCKKTLYYEYLLFSSCMNIRLMRNLYINL